MEQIKPTELRAEDVRVGNYLKGYLTGQPIKVDWLVIKHLLDGNILSLYAPDKPAYEPIPLTEEVLRAAGFDPDYDGNLRKSLPARMELWFYRGNPAEMDLRQDGKYISFKCAHVKYLHELQNLYFALTGSELEVSLPLIGTDNK